ncbi:MAG: aromatic ring-hydroxylating dioxygenase subunit alpha [Hydrococcus sp. Prado102]|jgi:phenylpropionate dioxygenase-like ring-hydroxylating dioxygenase large terminal subunit|nr:aromatic ring-hydroxylating dioxygenase subunit alpha [Hydrococcus sp. Prado102]
MKENLKAALLANAQEPIFFDRILYCDRDLLPLEQEYIFRRTWLYIGDSASLSTGDVLVTEAAGSSILIVRSQDGKVKAFHNVCPHRASLLCANGIQQVKQFVCPYHAWVFNLEGQLIGTPHQEGLPNIFRFEDYSLKPLRCEQWQGFIFVSFSDNVPPLLEYLGDIPASLGRHRTDATKLFVKKHYRVACNWKNFHDNTLCDYHLRAVHPKTLHPIQGPVHLYEHHFSEYVNLLYTPTTPQWREENQVLEHLTGRIRIGNFTYGIFPNLHLVALPNGMLGWLRIDPITVDTCQVNLEVYGIPGITEEPAELEAGFDATTCEDIAITEGVQRGYASGAYTPGIAHRLESRILHHQRLIRRFLLRVSDLLKN